MERSGSVGRVLDWGSKGCLFETHQSHSVVSLSMTLCLLLRTGSTQEDRKLSQHDCKIVDWDVKHQSILDILANGTGEAKTIFLGQKYIIW